MLKTAVVKPTPRATLTKAEAVMTESVAIPLMV
jgi:hypothetical protein